MGDDAIKAREAVNAAFRARRHETATEEELRDWLSILCTETAANERLHPRDVVRGLTINHIQTTRFLERLDRQNGRFGWFVFCIALFSMVASILQALVALGYIRPRIVSTPALEGHRQLRSHHLRSDHQSYYINSADQEDASGNQTGDASRKQP